MREYAHTVQDDTSQADRPEAYKDDDVLVVDGVCTHEERDFIEGVYQRWTFKLPTLVL